MPDKIFDRQRVLRGGKAGGYATQSYGNHEASNVFLKARLGALPLRWRRHRFDLLTPGKLCPVFAEADET